MTKKTKTKKTEKKQDNWWRKYTTEYQDEDFEKKGTPVHRGTGTQKLNQPEVSRPKKTLVRFDDNDMLPDMSNVAKQMENMVRGIFKSGMFADTFSSKPALPKLMKMDEGTFRKPISGVNQTSDRIIVTIELPGVKKEDIKIHIDGMNLIIEAQSQTGSEDKKRGFFSFSKSYTGFRHIVRLPAPVDKESSQANYDSGVLRVILKKKKSRESGDIPLE